MVQPAVPRNAGCGRFLMFGAQRQEARERG